MFSIQKADTKDCLVIADIHFTSWNAAYTGLLPECYIRKENSLARKITLWQEIIVNPDVTVWIAYDSSDEKNQHSVGFIGYFNTGNDYEITTLYVLPEYHGLGIGSELMDTALNNVSASNGKAKLHLWVLETNSTAIRFYQKHGFIANGVSSEESFAGSRIVDIKMVKAFDANI